METKDILKRIDNKETFYVYFGDRLCPWCRSVIEKSIERLEEISKMIKEIYDKLNNVAMKKLFISKLCMFNIQPLEYQAKYKFKEEGIHTYDVNDEFPKLTKNNIPKCVYDVKYKINLSGVSYLEKEV